MRSSRPGRASTPEQLELTHPYQTGQVPYFNAINVPDDEKEFVVLDSGHVPNWNDVIRYTLDWYDRYLGPVR